MHSMENSIFGILNILNKVRDKRSIVIGDILLDEYIYGTVSRVSTGIQIPIVEKEYVEYQLGGAANVAANVAGLCNDTTLIGRCANDDAGNMVKKICKERGIKLYSYLSDKTTVKQRIYIDNQQVSRIDTNSYTESVSVEMDSALQELDAEIIIIADYLYGVVTQSVIEKLISYCEKKKIPLLIASRELNRLVLNSTPVVVVNQKEWDAWNESDSQREAFITMGNKGIRYISESGRIEKETEKKYPVNVSGAGDTVLAVISMLYGEEINIEDLLNIANLAGELAVANELTYVLKHYDLVDVIYEQWTKEDSINKIADISFACDIVSAWRMEGKKIVFTNGCYDLLHLGHIKSFQYSKKFGDKLVVAINSDESIKRLKGEGRPINNFEERVSTLAYLSMVDMVIPFDEDTAISVIKKIEPDTYIKGTEYKQKELLEAKYARRVEYVPMIEGTSTTQIIKKIAKAVENDE